MWGSFNLMHKNSCVTKSKLLTVWYNLYLKFTIHNIFYLWLTLNTVEQTYVDWYIYVFTVFSILQSPDIHIFKQWGFH